VSPSTTEVISVTAAVVAGVAAVYQGVLTRDAITSATHLSLIEKRLDRCIAMQTPAQEAYLFLVDLDSETSGTEIRSWLHDLRKLRDFAWEYRLYNPSTESKMLAERARVLVRDVQDFFLDSESTLEREEVQDRLSSLVGELIDECDRIQNDKRFL